MGAREPHSREWDGLTSVPVFSVTIGVHSLFSDNTSAGGENFDSAAAQDSCPWGKVKAMHPSPMHPAGRRQHGCELATQPHGYVAPLTLSRMAFLLENKGRKRSLYTKLAPNDNNCKCHR